MTFDCLAAACRTPHVSGHLPAEAEARPLLLLEVTAAERPGPQRGRRHGPEDDEAAMRIPSQSPLSLGGHALHNVRCFREESATYPGKVHSATTTVRTFEKAAGMGRARATTAAAERSTQSERLMMKIAGPPRSLEEALLLLLLLLRLLGEGEGWRERGGRPARSLAAHDDQAVRVGGTSVACQVSGSNRSRIARCFPREKHYIYH